MPAHSDQQGLAVYFVVEKIEEKRAGIEHGVLRRTVAFEDQLGLASSILTVNFNPQFDEIHRGILQRKEVSERAIFKNLYDDFLEVDCPGVEERTGLEPSEGLNGSADGRKEGQPPIPNEDWSSREVPDTLDQKVFDQRDRLRMYMKRAANGRLQYINHFYDGKKWRRDTYASGGRLTRVQYLDDSSGMPMYEHYFRRDGTLAIVTRLISKGKNAVPVDIQLMDRYGAVEKQFNSQQDFIQFWFAQVFEASEKRVLIVCDRNQRLYQPLISAKKKADKKNHWRVVPFLHNTHIRHGGDPKTGQTKASYKWVLNDINLPDAVIVSTERQKQDIENRYGHGNIWVIPNVFVDRKTSSEAECREFDRMTVVCVGRYAIEKNHEDAMTAFIHVLREFPRAKLVFHGHGPRRGELSRRISEMGLEKSVFLKGYTHRVGDVFNKAAVSILTSREEGFPQVVLQSLSHGCPVVSYDVNYGPASMIQDGYNGYIVPTGDTEELATKLLLILGNADKQFSMRTNALNSSAKFDIEHHARKWSALIADLLPG